MNNIAADIGKKIDTNYLALYRTQLANQNTYMADIRTGLAITAIAIPFKKYYIVVLGLLMIFVSTFEYYYISSNLRKGYIFDIGMFELMPIITTVIILSVCFFESRNIHKFKMPKLHK